MKMLAENTAPDPVALVSKGREEEPKKFHAATREGLKRLLVPVEPALHKQLKMLAVQQDTTLEALARAALIEYVSKQ